MRHMNGSNERIVDYIYLFSIELAQTPKLLPRVPIVLTFVPIQSRKVILFTYACMLMHAS